MSGATGGSRAGTRFGPYYLRRLIGAGGFGEVYEAQDTVRGRIVALKLLPEALSNDPVFRKRMQREAQAAGRLQEPHVVPIHDYGEIDGLLYVDMRLIDGTDLRAVLKGGGPLPSARAVAIVGQIASALDAAHAAGVMHRDIKPENILVTDDDFAYLVDFGLATAAGDERLTRIGSMVGTFSYMSPERFRNMELTHRSDIYSLACVLHECLTGSRPYDANELGAMITAHLTAPIPRPSMIRPGIPAGFNTVIERGMAKNPEGRYASAGEMALAALDVLGSTEKRRATTIFERSKEATQPKGAGVIREAPTTPYRPPPPTLPPVAPSSAPPTIGSGPMQRFAAPGYTPQRNFGSGPQQAVTPPPYSSGPQYPVTPPAWTPQSPRSGPEPSKGKRKLWVLGGAIAVLIAVLVVGFWKPGFFVTTALDVTRAEAEIQRVLTDETDGYDAKNVEDLKCNDGQNPTAKKGDTFDCEVTIDGTKREVTVTFQDNNGAFEVGRPK